MQGVFMGLLLGFIGLSRELENRTCTPQCRHVATPTDRSPRHPDIPCRCQVVRGLRLRPAPPVHDIVSLSAQPVLYGSCCTVRFV